jgi:uncharacterized protein
MKWLSFYSLLVIASICACKTDAPNNNSGNEPAQEIMAYDSSLALKLGADEYGMKHYVMAFLKAGPNQDMDSVKAAELQRAHLDNIFRLADEGKLVIAGPFMDGGELKGVYVFNVATVEEAEALTNTDPAVKAGRFIMELHPWYGSAAACMINDQHKRIQKTKI